MNKNKNGSFIVGALIALAVAAVAGIVAGTETGREAAKRACTYVKELIGGTDGGEDGGTQRRIDEGAIANAGRNLGNLFKSAQQNFIHKNGKRMAASIEELGENFTIGSNGTIIYREIWYARYGRPDSDIPEPTKQEDWEKKALADPYRYAVLPVSGLETPELDARTSVLVALPVAETDSPALIVVAGPVRNDPADFLREWPVLRIVTQEGCRFLRELVDAGAAYDRTFADKLAPHIEAL